MRTKGEGLADILLLCETEVLPAVIIKTAVFWDVKPYSLVDR